MSFFERGNSVTTLEFTFIDELFEVWSMLMSPSRRVCPTTWRLEVGPLTSTPTPRLPVVVSMTVFDEAPTNVIVSTLLKSSVPWGVAIGIVSTIWGGFFKLGKANGFCLIRDKCFALGTLFSYKVGGTLEEIFKLRFRPTIGFLHSTCNLPDLHLLVLRLEIPTHTHRLLSKIDMVVSVKNYFYRGDKSSLRSVYFYFHKLLPKFRLGDIHTTSYSGRLSPELLYSSPRLFPQM